MNKYDAFYRPKLGEAWLLTMGIFLVAGTVLSALVVSIFGLSSLAGGASADETAEAATSGSSTLLMYVVSFLPVLCYVFFRSKGLYKKAQLFGFQGYPNPKPQLGKIPWPALILILPLGIVSMSFLVDPLTSWMEMPEFLKKVFAKMSQSDLPTFLSVVVCAPLLEEWLLRRVALKGLLQHTKPWVAIVMTALMFAIMHMNPWQAIPAFLLGCVFGWVYYRTRSYWICVCMHAINNGASFLIASLFPDMPADASLTYFFPGSSYYLVLAASLVVFVFLAWLMNKYLAPAPNLNVNHE